MGCRRCKKRFFNKTVGPNRFALPAESALIYQHSSLRRTIIKSSKLEERIRKNTLLALSLSLGATACGITPLEVDPRIRYNADFDQSQLTRGYEFVIFLKSDDPNVPVDSNGFVSQADCAIKNNDFSGNVPVNTRVVVPVYSYKPSPLRIKCTSANKSVSATKEAEMVVTNTLGNAVGVSVTDNLAGAVGSDGTGARADITAQNGDWSYKYIYLDL